MASLREHLVPLEAALGPVLNIIRTAGRDLKATVTETIGPEFPARVLTLIEPSAAILQTQMAASEHN